MNINGWGLTTKLSQWHVKLRTMHLNDILNYFYVPSYSGNCKLPLLLPLIDVKWSKIWFSSMKYFLSFQNGFVLNFNR